MKPPIKLSWTSDVLITFHMSRNALRLALGDPDEANVPMDGLGSLDAWLFTFPCGLELLVNGYIGWSERGDNFGPDEPAPVNILANRTERNHLLFHLPVVGEELWFAESCSRGPQDWALQRQDDNGNEFEVARYTSKCEAAEHQRRFERLGHKQVYWLSNLGRSI